MKTEELQKQIWDALTGRREWLEEGALMDLLDPPSYDNYPRVPPRYDEDARHDARAALSELVGKGVVGRSYMYEDPGGLGSVGRVYYVWLKTPETAELDRRTEQLDREWAIVTGGLFGHDRELLVDEP